MDLLSSTFGLLAAASWLLTVAWTGIARSRFFAIFAGVYVGLSMLVGAGLLSILPCWAKLALVIFEGLLCLHFVVLSWPRLRPLWYRALVSVPALTFAGATLLAAPWALLAASGLPAPGWFAPYLLALLGLYQSLRNPFSSEDLIIDGADTGPLARVPAGGPARGHSADDERPLRVVQLTDPHLGPFMSPARLARICERAVAQEPDLLFITGDLMTMESQNDVPAMRRALEPLEGLAADGKVFACYGNHDHEDRRTVAEALGQLGIRLLVDEAARVETPSGEVEVVGADFRFRRRREHLEALFEALGPEGDVPRILLLHDPGAFALLPDNAASLTLSGHTHGGQLGLVSLGLPWTIVSLASKVPDHGYWGQGRARLYVHRGSGHYGFPIRLGVPGEESVLRVWGLWRSRS